MGDPWDAAQEHPHLGTALLQPWSVAGTGFEFGSSRA